MHCPFLQEARVRFCHAASFRKMLMQSVPAGAERCSSPSYTECSVYRSHAGAAAVAIEEAGVRCPYLHESMVQMCAAASASRPVPWSESTLIRCGQSGYRFCEVYLAFAHPLPSPEDDAEGIELPRALRYTPNHMWLDVADDGSWRVGVDGLLAHALGRLDSVEFLTETGLLRPAAVLTGGQTELHAAFPHELPVAACNSYVRADPSRVTESPYTSGWLFRGDRLPGMPSGLIPGDKAREWMLREMTQVAAFAHDQVAQVTAGTMADGGMPERGFVAQLPRAERLRFVNTFFSPWRSGRS
jgi:glycine cleavage system H lipoate-binding protein